MIKKLKKYSLFAFCAMIAGGYILSVQAPFSHTKTAIHSVAAEVHGPGSGDDGSGDNNNNGNNNGNNDNNNGSGDNSGSGASSPNPGGGDSTIITGDDTPL